VATALTSPGVVVRGGPTAMAHSDPRRYCEHCRVLRPLRTEHCAVAGACVRRFDHFSAVVGAPVGARNQHYFLVLTLMLALAEVIFSCLAVETLYLRTSCGGGTRSSDLGHPKVQFLTTYFATRHPRTYCAGEAIWRHAPLFGALVVAALAFFRHTFFLAVRALCGAVANLTVHEMRHWPSINYLQDDQGWFRNPFDKGFASNIAEFFSACDDVDYETEVGYADSHASESMAGSWSALSRSLRARARKSPRFKLPLQALCGATCWPKSDLLPRRVPTQAETIAARAEMEERMRTSADVGEVLEQRIDDLLNIGKGGGGGGGGGVAGGGGGDRGATHRRLDQRLDSVLAAPVAGGVSSAARANMAATAAVAAAADEPGGSGGDAEKAASETAKPQTRFHAEKRRKSALLSVSVDQKLDDLLAKGSEVAAFKKPAPASEGGEEQGETGQQ